MKRKALRIILSSIQLISILLFIVAMGLAILEGGNEQLAKTLSVIFSLSSIVLYKTSSKIQDILFERWEKDYYIERSAYDGRRWQ